MGSHAALMLYNIAKTAVVECILAVFDAIKNDHLKHHELKDPLRNQQLRFIMITRNSIKTRTARTKEMIDNISLDILSVNVMGRFNGNVDLRTILNIRKGSRLQLRAIPNKDGITTALKAVKGVRNHLAHGDVSYSNFGSIILLPDIIKYKKDTLDFLSFFINQVEEHISNKGYRE